MFRIFYTFASIIILTAICYGADEWDALEEAQGLPDESEIVSKEVNSTSRLSRFRGYGIIEHLTQQSSQSKNLEVKFPNLEIALTAEANMDENYIQFFFEGRSFYRATEPKNEREIEGLLEQIGVRWRPYENFVIAIGKERNRRSPGLIVSPSDFLHTSESLPGMRRERNGIWLIRASYQEAGQTLDIIALPFDKIEESGLPGKNSHSAGGALRYFKQFANLDLSLSIGKINDTQHKGVSGQFIAFDVWKFYAEIGQKENTISSLGGISYEGSNTFMTRVEVYHNGNGLDKTDWQNVRNIFKNKPLSKQFATSSATPFIRQNYAIASVTFPDILDQFNMYETLIKSLEDKSYINLARFEWLANDNQIIGTSLVHIDKSEHTQYLARSFNWQLSVDWQYNF